MTTKLLKISDVSVHYGSTVALQSVDLTIWEDDFLGIIGPNGGGKTTLVKAILGEVPYCGTINHQEALYHGNTLKIGYLPQKVNTDKSFPITVSEVVLSGLQNVKRLVSRYNKKDRALAFYFLEEMGIEALANCSISEISGGQMQRALLCRALISDPKLLILDEPTNFVDSKFEKDLYTKLRELNKRMAIVMVSHDIGTITSVVKSIVCVNKTVHRHDSNIITAEQLSNYGCPIQVLSHGDVPHTVLERH